jgi:hypothetical protein
MAPLENPPPSGEITRMNAPAKIGRPSLMTPEMAEAICEQVMLGSSVQEISADPRFPGEATIYRWLQNDPIFREMYACAREAQADRHFDVAWAIARDATVENAHVARLQVDTIKWRAGKLAPRKYGDNRQVAVTGADGGAIQVENRQVLDLAALDDDQRDQLREILEAARGRAAIDVTPKEDGE